ncbi:MAG TPA: DNA circularization N-terminal domain-containing protein [Ktedonobacteraceae bacterium]
MSQISQFSNPWRDALMQQASFKGVIFHVETGARLSGRRTVVHEYPKRNDPYSEDMGRQARRFHIQGYLIYRPNNPLYEYTSQRYALYSALESDDAGKLIHPSIAPGGMQCMCERFTMVENRQRGGFTEFEMQFVEAGSAGNSMEIINTVSQVASQASNVDNSAKAMANNAPTDSVWSSGAPAFRDTAGQKSII